MRRMHLFEIEDQPWLPSSIRNGITDFLQFAVEQGNLYKNFSVRLAKVLRAQQVEQIVDLCAGGGGPGLSMLKNIPEINAGKVKIHLTDYYPNLPAFAELASTNPHCFTYTAEPVSALDVPSHLKGFRTLFSSFHHFDQTDAQTIIADAINSRQGIAIAESTQRHPLLIAYMFVTPILVLITSPFQKPFRWSRLFWTYAIPIVPIAVAFDGIVSCLRTYTPAELMGLVANIPNSSQYDWDAGVERIGFLPIGVTYLIGTPKSLPE
ncbi:MAG: class I SAM-dependent methyltransferase [Paucibacter sp.]|nr:class I SAM-dependent methyltransferase [Roseateles sp.]